MSEKKLSLQEREQRFYKFIVAEYLKYGSVDEVFKVHRYDLPISYPSYQRLLDEWGIVKAAGPNSRLSEALLFMARLAEEKIPLETLYKRMPPSFQTSMGTMHRIYAYIKEGITRRVGVALVMTPYNKQDYVLVGNDISTPRIELGKPFRSVSLPMGFSRKRDSRQIEILRVLQQEVFTKQAIEQDMPMKVIPEEPSPFMYLDVADVRVAAYHISLPPSLSNTKNFSSFKLDNHRFLRISEIVERTGRASYRVGLAEIVSGYQRRLEIFDRNLIVNPFYEKSVLNKKLADLAIEPSRL